MFKWNEEDMYEDFSYIVNGNEWSFLAIVWLRHMIQDYLCDQWITLRLLQCQLTSISWDFCMLYNVQRGAFYYHL